MRLVPKDTNRITQNQPLKECITIIKDRIIREIPYSKKVKERK